MAKFRNSGQYIGGSTLITRFNKSWFSKGSVQKRRTKAVYKSRSIAADMELVDLDPFIGGKNEVGEQRIVTGEIHITPSMQRTLEQAGFSEKVVESNAPPPSNGDAVGRKKKPENAS